MAGFTKRGGLMSERGMHIYKAPGIPAARQSLESRRGVVVERLRGETTPDIIIGTGRTVGGNYDKLEQAATAKAAEIALAREIQAIGSLTLLDVELIAERTHEQYLAINQQIGSQLVAAEVEETRLVSSS